MPPRHTKSDSLAFMPPRHTWNRSPALAAVQYTTRCASQSWPTFFSTWGTERGQMQIGSQLQLEGHEATP